MQRGICIGLSEFRRKKYFDAHNARQFYSVEQRAILLLTPDNFTLSNNFSLFNARQITFSNASLSYSV